MAWRSAAAEYRLIGRGGNAAARRGSRGRCAAAVRVRALDRSAARPAGRAALSDSLAKLRSGLRLGGRFREEHVAESAEVVVGVAEGRVDHREALEPVAHDELVGDA